MILNREQKIAVLEKTIELLGPDGRNWARGYWFGQKGPNHKPGDASDAAYPLEHANCWCLEGAICEAAVLLELAPDRETVQGQNVGQQTSLRTQLGRPLFDYNDDPKTTWPDINRELRHRIEKLKSERPYDEQRRP